jgi:hypothetical protein
MQYDGSTPEQIPIASPIAMDTDLLKTLPKLSTDVLSTAFGPTCDTPIALPNDLVTYS